MCNKKIKKSALISYFFAYYVVAKSAKKGTQRAQRTQRCAELVWWLAWWFWVIRQRLLLAIVAIVGATPTANR